MNNKPRQDVSAVAQLCPSCGFCCNGVLFGNVELQATDDAAQLAAIGLRLEGKGRKVRFLQPCSCFDGRLCGIYAQRPSSCRAFECRLVQLVNDKKLSVEAALKAIAQARRQVEMVRRLVERLGQTDEKLPLSRRCSNIIAQPIDLAGDEAVIELRAELMLAVHELTRVLERDFLG